MEVWTKPVMDAITANGAKTISMRFASHAALPRFADGGWWCQVVWLFREMIHADGGLTT